MWAYMCMVGALVSTFLMRPYCPGKKALKIFQAARIVSTFICFPKDVGKLVS